MSAVYMTVCRYAVRAFSCFHMADGTSRLKVYPEVHCWSSTVPGAPSASHWYYIVAGTAAIAAYLFGFPMYVYRVLKHLDKTKQFIYSEEQRKYGRLYMPFHHHSYIYSLFVISRRTVFVFIVEISWNGQVQCFVAQLLVAYIVMAYRSSASWHSSS